MISITGWMISYKSNKGSKSCKSYNNKKAALWFLGRQIFSYLTLATFATLVTLVTPPSRLMYQKFFRIDLPTLLIHK